MAKTRTSASDHSNMAKLFKPVIRYGQTVTGAFGDICRAYKKASDASGDIRPGADARAYAANKNYDAEKGQLFGAILRGRRYDSKGKIKP